MNRNFMMGCAPRTPAPVRNANFLMSAAAVLETPTLLRKPSPTDDINLGKENAVCCSTSILQPPSAASAAAMQFLMFNQQLQQSTAAFGGGSGSSLFQRASIGKSETQSIPSGFSFAIPSIPDSTTTVSTRIVENFQVSSSDTSLKRKQEDNHRMTMKIPPKRVQFEPLPVLPRNRVNGKTWNTKALSAIKAKPSKQMPSHKEVTKPDAKKLRILTGSVEHIMKLTKSFPDGSPLVEVFANILSVKTGAYECEKILLLRNRSGPVMQGVFYEIDFRMPVVNVGDFVRCVGRLSGGSRLQILKITLASPEEERMSQRLQTGHSRQRSRRSNGGASPPRIE